MMYYQKWHDGYNGVGYEATQCVYILCHTRNKVQMLLPDQRRMIIAWSTMWETTAACQTRE